MLENNVAVAWITSLIWIILIFIIATIYKYTHKITPLGKLLVKSLREHPEDWDRKGASCLNTKTGQKLWIGMVLVGFEGKELCRADADAVIEATKNFYCHNDYNKLKESIDEKS